MRILITGGAGYLGSRLSHTLGSRGHQVFVYDRLFYGAQHFLPVDGITSPVVVLGDIRDEANLKKWIDETDIVIHLAAIVGDDACKAEPDLAETVNYAGANLLNSVLKSSKDKRLIFISTCSNYGVSDTSSIADESYSLNPTSEYAKAKIFAEELLTQTAAEGDHDITILRLATLCGLSPRMRFDLLVNEMARNLSLDIPIEIYRPDAWRPFLHIDDAINAIDAVVKTKSTPGPAKIYNVVGENLTKRELVNIGRDKWKESLFKVVQKSADIRDYRVSGQRFEKQFDFRPEKNVRLALDEVSKAVSNGFFRDPLWSGHSAIIKPG